MKTHNRLYYLGTGIAVFFVFLYILAIDNICFPWIDEIGTTDTAANVVMYGKWESHVWTYTYNPLHAFLLIGWLYVFGISHMTVCSLSLVLAFIAYFILLRILIQRDVLSCTINTIIYSLLFWGGYTFSTLLTQGRIDMLALVFSILLTNAIIPIESHFYSDNKWPLRLYSFFFMATAIYPVPLFLFFCITLFFMYKKNTHIRRGLVVRYKEILISFILSFSLICLFYLYHHTLFRFLQTFLLFSNTFSTNQMSLIEKISQAYSLEVQALILYGISILIIAINKNYNRNYAIICLFVFFIPFLMVIAGRYTIYYSWLFYVPVLVLFVYSIRDVHSVGFHIIALVLSFLPLLIKPVVTHSKRVKTYHKLDEIKDVVNNISKDFSSGENVLFFNSLFYYSLIDNKTTPWVHYGGLTDKPSPTEKFNQFCGKYIKNPATREKLFNALMKIEGTDQYLPDRGYVFVWGKEEMDNVISYFKSNQYRIKQHTQTDSIAIFYFQSY